MSFEVKDFSLKVETNLKESQNKSAKNQIVWFNVIQFTLLYISAFYGLYLCFVSAKFFTVLFAIGLYKVSFLGITAGVHRLWSHRSYKAKLPLQIFLLICNTIAFQDPVYIWARDHRVHHKYTETDADPYNAKRGLFFSHIGWLLCRKHPEVIEKGQNIEMSDLANDKLLMFQKKYYLPLILLFCFFLPTTIPHYFWNESLHNAFFICGLMRYCFSLNNTWMVNSIAHAFGNRPFDKDILAVDNSWLSTIVAGEGWHNYHHVFPWDYKTSELGKIFTNDTTHFINLCAKLGLAYDLKTVSEDVVRQRAMRTGDGSHPLWGWGDKDQTQNERDEALILKPNKH